MMYSASSSAFFSPVNFWYCRQRPFGKQNLYSLQVFIMPLTAVFRLIRTLFPLWGKFEKAFQKAPDMEGVWLWGHVHFNGYDLDAIRAILFWPNHINSKWATELITATLQMYWHIYIQWLLPWSLEQFSTASRHGHTPGLSREGSYTRSQTQHPCLCV